MPTLTTVLLVYLFFSLVWFALVIAKFARTEDAFADKSIPLSAKVVAAAIILFITVVAFPVSVYSHIKAGTFWELFE